MSTIGLDEEKIRKYVQYQKKKIGRKKLSGWNSAFSRAFQATTSGGGR